MGQSTDAILFFGIALPEEDFKLPWDSEDEDNYDDFEDWLLKQYDILRPENLSECGRDDYYERKSAFLKSEAPAELVHHCSDSYTMYALAIPGTVTKAYRGSVEAVTMYIPSKEQIDAFIRFLEKYGIPHSGERDFGWKLVSYWG